MEVLQNIQPFIEMGFQLIDGLGKLWHFKVNERQFIVEYFLCLVIGKLYVVTEFLFVFFVLVKDKVQDANGINSVEPVIPVRSLCLLLNRE